MRCTISARHTCTRCAFSKTCEALAEIEKLRDLCGRLADALVEFNENDQYTDATGDLVEEGRTEAEKEETSV